MSRALASMSDALVEDLESQGLRFSPEDVQLLKQRIQHEDLGTLALFFDEWGNFSDIKDVFAYSEPGSKLGDFGPGGQRVVVGREQYERFPHDLAGRARITRYGQRQEREVDLSCVELGQECVRLVLSQRDLVVRMR